jgi:hypothetical protein
MGEVRGKGWQVFSGDETPDGGPALRIQVTSADAGDAIIACLTDEERLDIAAAIVPNGYYIVTGEDMYDG